MQGLDETLEAAAKNLGANRWQTFRLVHSPAHPPASSPPRRLAFITSFDEVVVAIFRERYWRPTLPKQTWDGIRTEIDPDRGRRVHAADRGHDARARLLAVVRRRQRGSRGDPPGRAPVL